MGDFVRSDVVTGNFFGVDKIMYDRSGGGDVRQLREKIDLNAVADSGLCSTIARSICLFSGFEILIAVIMRC